MPSNPASARTGDLLLRAECRPDPVRLRIPARHQVDIENSGAADLYVKEVTVLVGRGGSNAALVLTRAGQRGASLSLQVAGTYSQWDPGSWTWDAQPNGTAAGHEVVVSTVLFDRAAALEPLDPDPPVALSCTCSVGVGLG